MRAVLVMPSKAELSGAIAGLMRAGVSIEDANRLLDVCARSSRNVLVLVPLMSEPRPGDVIRARLDDGPAQAMRVIEVAPTQTVDAISQVVDALRDQRRWACAGEPVAPSSADAAEVRR